jgi:hypothetical protein
MGERGLGNAGPPLSPLELAQLLEGGVQDTLGDSELIGRNAGVQFRHHLLGK